MTADSPRKTSAPPDEEIVRLGRYTLRYRIAQGGMASVYLARLSSAAGFEKWVAVKTIHPHIASNPKFVRMFLDEARLAAQLDHPNLCSVFDFGEADGTYYLAMEYLHGETLGAVARKAYSERASMPRDLSARVVADAARGLHAAHELRAEDGRPAGVVHRDVSPENIFVTYRGVAKVVDFGVARSNQQAADRTATGELKGKLAYMSPEQMQDHPIDRRTDVWALGVVLWEITVGRRLFRRHTDGATVLAVIRDTIPRPSRLKPDYPRALEAIVMRALERDPEKRYQSAHDLARALESYLTSTGVPMSTDEIGDYMHGLFAEQIEFREQYLRRSQKEEPVEELVSLWHTGSVPQSETPGPIGSDAPPRPSHVGAVSESTSPAPDEDPDAVATWDRNLEVHPPPVHTALPESEDEVSGSAPTMPAPSVPAPTLLSLPPEGLPELPLRKGVVTLRTQAAPRHRRWPGTLLALGLMLLGVAVIYVWLSPSTPRPAPPHASADASATPPREITQEPHDAGARVATPTPLPVPPSQPATNTTDAGPALTANTVDAGRRHVASPSHPRGETPPTPDNTVDESASGYVTMTTNRACDVYENGTLLGRTPVMDRAFSPGHHLLRFVPIDGSPERTHSVEVFSGVSSRINLRWETATEDPPTG
jgi:serine/threonine-protein kinase